MNVLKTSILAAAILGLSVGAVADSDKPRVFQTSPVINGESGAEVGAAWLRRSENRVDGRIMTNVSMAGIPYTVWWVIFNNPDGCLDSCGPGDLADGGVAARVAVFNASGAISAADGSSGNGVINLDLSVIGGEGAGRGAQDSPAPFAPARFFYRALMRNNARCAEIHLDINVHTDLDDPVDWVTELTYPEAAESFAVFPPAPDC